MERMLRFFQATAQILSSYTLPFNLLLSGITLAAEKPPSPDATYAILLALRQRLGLIRRFFRLFRFLESFHAAHKLYLGAAATAGTTGTAPLQTDEWLDILGRTFNGMYLLLEASTTADALAIDGLALWAPETARRLALEAQRFWLFALVCGVLAGSLRAVKVLAYTPVPVPGPATTGAGSGGALGAASEDRDTIQDSTTGEKGEGGEGRDGDGDGDEKWDLQREQARLRGLASERRKARVLWRRDVQAKIRRLGRGVVANALDVALPGTAVGWLDLEPGTVGVAMLVTSILTGLEVWERCGREVDVVGRQP